MNKKSNFPILLVSLQLVILTSATSLKAQHDTIISQISLESGNRTSGYGRDFWLAFPQNQNQHYNGLGAGDDSTQAAVFAIKSIYIGAQRNTVVKVQVQGQPDTLLRDVIAGEITILQGTPDTSNGKGWGDIPRKTELYTSGVVKNDKAIHIWSDDADLSVYAESDLGGGEGMYVIPAMGWGTEYVVATYTSNYFHGISYYPSEFVVIADEDSTVITVTPSRNIRSNESVSISGHGQGTPFTQLLNRGQCVQYQAVAPQTDVNNLDLTGTVVTSNKAVGVIGANANALLPISDAAIIFAVQTKFLIDMIPPIRTWASSYFSAPFAGRKYGGDAFLVVASKNNQQISRNGQIIATLNKYGFSFLYDISEASEWKSASPFMLVQYMENADHDAPPKTQTLNFGNPSMVVVNPAQQFGKNIIFQTPGSSYYTNYVNLILPINNENKTTFDGYRIDNIPGIATVERFPIGGSGWEAIRLGYPRDSGYGTHTVVSDTGVGVYIYGLTYNDSYAWAGNLGVITPNSPDVIPPDGTINNSGFTTDVHLKDKRKNDSRISEIEIDSLFNMKYVRDSTFIAGSGRDSSFYHISVIDTSKPAYSLISTYDFAGNRTRVTSKYVKQSAVVLTLSDFDFGCIVVGSSKVDTATIATNSSQNSVTIDSVWVDDHIHFAFAGTPKLPVLLKSGLPQSFQFQYTAIGVEQDTTTIHFRSPEAGIRTAKLIGCGITPNSVRSYGYTSSLSRESPEYISLSSQLDRGNELALLPAIPNPATASGKSVRFVYGLRSDSPLDLSLFDILGNLIVTVVHVEHQSAGIYESDFPIGADMPAGSYIYRLAGTGKILSGKLVITR